MVWYPLCVWEEGEKWKRGYVRTNYQQQRSHLYGESVKNVKNGWSLKLWILGLLERSLDSSAQVIHQQAYSSSPSKGLLNRSLTRSETKRLKPWKCFYNALILWEVLHLFSVIVLKPVKNNSSFNLFCYCCPAETQPSCLENNSS